MFKRTKLDHTTKWPTYKPESVLETHKILRDIEIQTDILILPRNLDLELMNKRKKKELVI